MGDEGPKSTCLADTSIARHHTTQGHIPTLQVFLLKSTGTRLYGDPASHRDAMPVSNFAYEFQKARRDAAGSC